MTRTAHADRRPLLHGRARALGLVRQWFAAQGFIEADVAALVSSPGAEVHLHAYSVGSGYLHTSPEFALKKLLAAGEDRLFYLGKVWRAEPAGPKHATEFTMAEWYRVGVPWQTLASDTLDLIASVARGLGVERLNHAGVSARFDDVTWITVEHAFALAGIEGLLETINATVDAVYVDRNALADKARSAGVSVQVDDDWGDIFSKMLTARVEPALPADRLVVLHDYPAPEAALSRRKAEDPRVAERFEVYACGVELANGFGELTDPAEQRRRFVAAMNEKARRYGAAWPIDEDFLSSLSDLPESSGVALGFDRLIMLALGAPRLADVLWSVPAASDR